MSFEFQEFGFGLYGWSDGSLAIVGGMRAGGFHQAGKMRTLFSAYDLQSGQLELAKMTLLVSLADSPEDNPTVDGLINIEIPKQLRGKGSGRKIIDALRQIAPGDLRIMDIKPKARGFWTKMGATDFTKSGKQLDAVVPRAAARQPVHVDSDSGLQP